MRYQKRHYEDAAEIFANALKDPTVSDAAKAGVRLVASEFVSMFAVDNGRFDRSRFRKAAGLED